MRFSFGLPAVLIGVSSSLVIQQQVLANLETSQIKNLAEKVTVLVQGKNNFGSGVIIARENNTYHVLTTSHTFDNQDEFQIVTYNNSKYSLTKDNITKFPGVDLALLEFKSRRNYQVVTVGNYNPLELWGIAASHIYGWSEASTNQIKPLFSCGLIIRKELISFFIQNPVTDGYELAYSNITHSGMSGSPVLDSAGRLIGIHGRVEGDVVYGEPLKMGFSLGISSQEFLRRVSLMGIKLPLKVENTSPSDPHAKLVPTSGKNVCENPNLIQTIEGFPEIEQANLANHLLRQFKLEEARNAYNQALKEVQSVQDHPGLYHLWYGKGLTLLFLGRPQAALASFEEAIQILNEQQAYESKEVEALQDAQSLLLRFQGNILKFNGNYKEALNTYNKAIEIKPEHEILWILKGDTLQSIGRRQEAIDAYRKAIDIKPHI